MVLFQEENTNETEEFATDILDICNYFVAKYNGKKSASGKCTQYISRQYRELRKRKNNETIIQKRINNQQISNANDQNQTQSNSSTSSSDRSGDSSSSIPLQQVRGTIQFNFPKTKNIEIIENNVVEQGNKHDSTELKK